MLVHSILQNYRMVWIGRDLKAHLINLLLVSLMMPSSSAKCSCDLLKGDVKTGTRMTDFSLKVLPSLHA